MDYMREIAESFVNVDWDLETRLRDRTEEIGSDMPDTPLAVIYGVLREGAVLYKYNELVRTHEEAKREVK
jgi:hypothetical protein